MRIRQVKPAFWQDAKIASLPHDARLFYIGLWMLADDDGWLRWDVAEIGKELYGFEGRASREKRVERMAEQIVRMPGSEKLVVHQCGHVELPKLAVHQHLAGTTRRVTAIHLEHAKCPPDDPSRDSPQIPATPRKSPRRVGKGEGVGEGVSEGVVSVSEGAGALRARGSNGVQKNPQSNDDQWTRMMDLLNDTSAPVEKREMARTWLSRQNETGNARAH